MRNMRKALPCILLAISMLMLSACAAQTQDADQSKIQTPSESPSNANEATESEESGFAQNTDRFRVDGTIEETTLVDNDEIAVVAKDIEYRNDTAYLNIAITNKTKDPFTVLTNTLSYSGNYINDYMVSDGYLNCDVAPGATEEEELGFSFDGLEMYGMKGVGEIGLGLRVTDEDLKTLFQEIMPVKTSLNGDPSIKIGDFSDVIGNAENQAKRGYAFTPASSIDQSIEEAGIAVVSGAIVTNKENEKSLVLEVENRTNEVVNVVESEISLDGVLASEGRWSTTTVAPGKRAVIDTDLTYISEHGDDPIDISSIKEVGLHLGLADANENTILDPSEVTVAF